MLLAQPIMAAIAPIKNPLVLDVATGTARLPLALLRHRRFQGHIVGADLSRRMLAGAAYKLEGDRRVSLIWTPAEHLPFPDNTFRRRLLPGSARIHGQQRSRPARDWCACCDPAACSVTTNRINTRLMPGKTCSDEQMQRTAGIAGRRATSLIEYWQVDYNRVWGDKAGASKPTLARPLAEVLRCPHCNQALLVEARQRLGLP